MYRVTEPVRFISIGQGILQYKICRSPDQHVRNQDKEYGGYDELSYGVAVSCKDKLKKNGGSTRCSYKTAFDVACLKCYRQAVVNKTAQMSY